MLFNVDKCSVVHTGRQKKEQTYELCQKILKCTTENRYLGAIMYINLNQLDNVMKQLKKDRDKSKRVRETGRQTGTNRENSIDLLDLGVCDNNLEQLSTDAKCITIMTIEVLLLFIVFTTSSSCAFAYLLIGSSAALVAI